MRAEQQTTDRKWTRPESWTIRAEQQTTDRKWTSLESCVSKQKQHINNNMLPKLNITFTKCEWDWGTPVSSGKGCDDAIELAEQPL